MGSRIYGYDGYDRAYRANRNDWVYGFHWSHGECWSNGANKYCYWTYGVDGVYRSNGANRSSIYGNRANRANGFIWANGNAINRNWSYGINGLDGVDRTNGTNGTHVNCYRSHRMDGVYGVDG